MDIREDRRFMNSIVTILDIAREAGVSPSTVSRVLNGTVPVTEDKREAVLAVARKLHYQPNTVAQGLVRGRTQAIGILTQSIASPFYGEILLGIEQGLARSGYQPIIASGNWRTDDEIAALDVLSARRVDGLIVFAGVLSDDHLYEVASNMPLIVIGRSVAGIEHQCLSLDNFGAAEEATQLLISLGHRRIVHIAGPNTHQDAAERCAGYRQALTALGLPIDEQLIIQGDYTEQSGLMATQALLSRGVLFTALFAANDQMAAGARLALYRHNLRVPDDISLIGFDDQPASAYCIPPLTTVRQPTHSIGHAAAQAVLQLLDKQVLQLPNLTTELIIRESTSRRR